MADTGLQTTLASRSERSFNATHWTVILEAGRRDSPRSTEAREELCRTYWRPVYCCVRREGFSAPDAEDLTQAFFAHLLERNPFMGLSPQRGRFRSFVLTALRNFISDARTHARAAKRGSTCPPIPLDSDDVEERYLQAAPSLTAERAFDHRWATSVLERALARLREELHVAHKAEGFGELTAFLSREGTAADYAEAARRLHSTSAAVRMAVCRLRRRFRRCIRAEVARLVTNPAEVDDEMHYLLAVLTG